MTRTTTLVLTLLVLWPAAARARGVIMGHADYAPHVARTDPRHDPLFEQQGRPSWAQQHLTRPEYLRPSYGNYLPAYDPPHYNRDPIRKPVYEMPLMVRPQDRKPSDFLAKEAPPPAFWAREAMPFDRAPNYVIRPESAPAYHRPSYERSTIFYQRPEYLRPDDPPPSYRPPQRLPPQYMAPPR